MLSDTLPYMVLRCSWTKVAGCTIDSCLLFLSCIVKSQILNYESNEKININYPILFVSFFVYAMYDRAVLDFLFFFLFDSIFLLAEGHL